MSAGSETAGPPDRRIAGPPDRQPAEAARRVLHRLADSPACPSWPHDRLAGRLSPSLRCLQGRPVDLGIGRRRIDTTSSRDDRFQRRHRPNSRPNRCCAVGVGSSPRPITNKHGRTIASRCADDRLPRPHPSFSSVSVRVPGLSLASRPHLGLIPFPPGLPGLHANLLDLDHLRPPPAPRWHRDAPSSTACSAAWSSVASRPPRRPSSWCW